MFINEDVETYLRDLARIETMKPSLLGVRTTDGPVSKRILLSLQAYCVANKIRLVHFHEQLEEDLGMEKELISIAQNDIKISGFKGFRSIRFYKNPDISKETIEILQSTLIQSLIMRTYTPLVECGVVRNSIKAPWRRAYFAVLCSLG